MTQGVAATHNQAFFPPGFVLVYCRLPLDVSASFGHRLGNRLAGALFQLGNTAQGQFGLEKIIHDPLRFTLGQVIAPTQ